MFHRFLEKLTCNQVIVGTGIIWVLDGFGMWIAIQQLNFPWWGVVPIGFIVALVPIGIGIWVAINETVNME